jgi:hypothetical protein
MHTTPSLPASLDFINLNQPFPCLVCLPHHTNHTSRAIQAQSDGEQVSCRVHVANNTGSSDSNLLGHVRSSLKVLAAADIQDVSVILQVQHPDVAALQVSQGGGECDR